MSNLILVFCVLTLSIYCTHSLSVLVSRNGLDCVGCPPGTSSPGCKHVVNGTVTAQCPVGTCFTVKGCTVCPRGRYSDKYNCSTCSLCPAGQYQSLSGKTSCDECPAGSPPNPYHTACAACRPGQYAKGRNIECVNCPGGWYSAQPGMTACDECPAGTFASPGMSVCDECEADHISRSAGTEACSKCSWGLQSDGSRRHCEPTVYLLAIIAVATLVVLLTVIAVGMRVKRCFVSRKTKMERDRERLIEESMERAHMVDTGHACATVPQYDGI